MFQYHAFDGTFTLGGYMGDSLEKLLEITEIDHENAGAILRKIIEIEDQIAERVLDCLPPQIKKEADSLFWICIIAKTHIGHIGGLFSSSHETFLEKLGLPSPLEAIKRLRAMGFIQ